MGNGLAVSWLVFAAFFVATTSCVLAQRSASSTPIPTNEGGTNSIEGTGLSLGLGRQHREGAVTSTGEGMLGETVYDFGVILAPGKGVWASMGAPDLRFYVGYQRGTLSRNVAETDIAVVRHFRLRQRIVPHVMGGIGLYGLGPPIWVVAMGTDIMASSRLFVRLQYRLYADSSWIEWETGGLAGIGIRF